MIRTSKAVIVALCLSFLLSFTCFAETFSSQAISIAETFSATIDDKNYQAAYQSGSKLLHLTSTENQWISEIGRTREVLGTALQRKLKAVKSIATYPGLPDGEYMLVYFETKMEHKEKAAEVLLVAQIDGAWKVCSYHLK